MGDLPQFGHRKDGSRKGSGYFGAIRRPDGSVSTELSVGVSMDGEDREIPTMVPTLSSDELRHLIDGGQITRPIVDKAAEHARKRIYEGKSPYAEEGEQPEYKAGYEPPVRRRRLGGE